MMYRKRASGSFLQVRGGLSEVSVLLHTSARLSTGRNEPSWLTPLSFRTSLLQCASTVAQLCSLPSRGRCWSFKEHV